MVTAGTTGTAPLPGTGIRTRTGGSTGKAHDSETFFETQPNPESGSQIVKIISFLTNLRLLTNLHPI